MRGHARKQVALEWAERAKIIYKVDDIIDAMNIIQSIESIIELAIENVDLVIIFFHIRDVRIRYYTELVMSY